MCTVARGEPEDENETDAESGGRSVQAASVRCRSALIRDQHGSWTEHSCWLQYYHMSLLPRSSTSAAAGRFHRSSRRWTGGYASAYFKIKLNCSILSAPVEQMLLLHCAVGVGLLASPPVRVVKHRCVFQQIDSFDSNSILLKTVLHHHIKIHCVKIQKNWVPAFFLMQASERGRNVEGFYFCFGCVKCLPILTYWLEVCALPKLQSLGFTVNRVLNS